MGTIRLEDLPNYTYDDYKIWEGHWELLFGVPYAMSPSPVLAHQNISKAIVLELDRALENCQACSAVLALDWKINESTVVCPDNAVVCNLSPDDDYISKAPRIIFEILSPATKHKDRTIKFNLYQEHCVSYYVMVDPKGDLAEIYQLKNGHYCLVNEIKDDSFEFELGECQFSFDFGKLFIS